MDPQRLQHQLWICGFQTGIRRGTNQYFMFWASECYAASSLCMYAPPPHDSGAIIMVSSLSPIKTRNSIVLVEASVTRTASRHKTMVKHACVW